MIRILLIALLAALGLSLAQGACAGAEGPLYISNVRIFRDTPAWDLAAAVRWQNVGRIKAIIKKDPDLLNYQDPHYGATLLLWAVGTEKYRSAETLLQLGADPEIASTHDGSTPLYVAAGYSWVDRFAKKNPRYVELLLQYGADPNNVSFVGHSVPDSFNIVEPSTSPLMNSIGTGIEKTKALVDAGADINHKTKSGRTAAIYALRERHTPEYAHYLIVEQGATVSEPYYPRPDLPSSVDILYPVDQLRRWIPEIGSREHQLKMAIVDEFLRQGVNYWETEIPPDVLRQIKSRYPGTWEDYIQKY